MTSLNAYPDIETRVYVLGGLPVDLQVWIGPAEPDCGYPFPYAADWLAVNPKNGQPHHRWLYEKAGDELDEYANLAVQESLS